MTKKVLTAVAGLSLMLASGLASAAPSGTGGSGTGCSGSGVCGTGVDVIGALIASGNPSVTRSKVGGLANAICRITKSC